MPWFRKVFLVTANQIPNWLNASHPQIELVSHDDILPADSQRPTFNSVALEFSIHNITGLSEHFIYFNDDFFMLKAVAPEFFFTPDRKPIFSSRTSVKYANAAKKYKKTVAEYRMGNLKESFWLRVYKTFSFLEKHFKKKLRGQYLHAPTPLTKTMLVEISQKFAKEIRPSLYSSFREPDNFQFQTFAMLYVTGTNQSVMRNRFKDVRYITVNSKRQLTRLKKMAGNVCAVAINEVSAKMQNAVEKITSGWYPTPSRFERVDK